MTDLIKLADDYARAFVGALVTKDVLLRPKGAQNIEVARAALAAEIAANDVRRAEELAAYELTVSSLRADAERDRQALEAYALTVGTLRAENQNLQKDTDRMAWVAQHASIGLDSGTGLAGGNGQKRVAATRSAVDKAMKGEK